MARQWVAFLVSGLLLAGGDFALAHHSFAMFDQDDPVDLVGTVQEFKFTSPHTFIILKVKDKDGNVKTWSLEVKVQARLSAMVGRARRSIPATSRE